MPADDRWISLSPGTVKLPERLLLAQARGNVIFISGAGISRASGLPDFRGLVVEVYRRIDPTMHHVLDAMVNIPLDPSIYATAESIATHNHEHLSPPQLAELRRFSSGDYDVVLGLLERRIDGRTLDQSRVRQAVCQILDSQARTPAPIHRALMRLADRGGVVTTMTTNFDLLLERSVRRGSPSTKSYSLGGIPRPSRNENFSGVLHIHGALSRRQNISSDFVLTDHDFGEFYLRRRVVPDLIYDAARLFHLVLVGYSANDAPMRYLLNAVAADGFRFDDLKERFAFVGAEAPAHSAQLEDWKGRGITPIPYPTAANHAAVSDTLERWAAIAPGPRLQARTDAELRRIVRTKRSETTEADRDLFDHLARRSSLQERVRMASYVGRINASIEWLDAINSISRSSRGDSR